MATEPQPKSDEQDGELSRVLQRFQKIAEQGRARETAEGCTEPPAPGKVVQLPLWPKAAPGAPNPVLRSALFAAIKSKGL